MHDDELDKLIGDRLSGFEQDPKHGSFDKILEGVAATKRLVLYRYVAAASTVLLLTAGASYWWMKETPVPVAADSVETVGLHDGQAIEEELGQASANKATETLEEMNVDKETRMVDDADNVSEQADGGVDYSGFDALVSDRSYEKEMSGEKEAELIVGDKSLVSKDREAKGVRVDDTADRNGVNFALRPVPQQWVYKSLVPPAAGFQFVPHIGSTNEGQPVVVKPERERRWSVYAEAMPFFSYNIFEVNTTDEILITNVQQVPGFSLERLGVRGEVGVEYAINRKIHIQTGVMMYSRNQEANLIVGKVDSVIVSTKADSYSLTPVYTSDTLNMSVDILNLGLSVGVQFRLNDGKIRQWVGVSAEMHKGLKRNITFDHLVSQEGSAGYYSFANLFYRAEYPWKPRATFFLQPTFNYSLYMGERLATPVNVRPYGLGASLGIRIRL
ncbi:MAG: hypothetical protein RIF36_22035 [Imperialibacter sp.]|uniref:hypothetical protein n=1 Tax=Imperialibacter sp. TaxID=2038411 RepID=UPI0032EF7683